MRVLAKFVYISYDGHRVGSWWKSERRVKASSMHDALSTVSTSIFLDGTVVAGLLREKGERFTHRCDSK